MRKRLVLVLIVVVGVVAIGGLLINRLRYFRQEIKACFGDVRGLRVGATVRVAGVDVGIVRSVRANPQNTNCPAEVEMRLATTYEIRIPRDSIAGIEKAGLLGEDYVSIDIANTSGPPIENYGYLGSKPSKPMPSLSDQVRAAGMLLRLVQVTKESGKEAPSENSPSHINPATERPRFRH